jgi:hypothetical protein
LTGEVFDPDTDPDADPDKEGWYLFRGRKRRIRVDDREGIIY